jgi:hypothetical protein
MKITSGEFATMVFKRVDKNDLGEFSIDSQTLNVLMSLDGSKTVTSLAQEKGMSIGTLRDTVTRLLELKLIEPNAAAIPIIDGDFLTYLIQELSQAVGPIAQILIEDAVVDLGNDLNRIPAHRAAELVELLAPEIQHSEKATLFKQNMISKIKEKGY